MAVSDRLAAEIVLGLGQPVNIPGIQFVDAMVRAHDSVLLIKIRGADLPAGQDEVTPRFGRGQDDSPVFMGWI